MAYPFYNRRDRPIATAIPCNPEPCEWRCHEKDKLLGVRHGALLHIRFERHCYVVSLPVEAECRGCGTPNRT